MKNKILFLAHSQSIHTKRWVQYFVEQDWDVHIITFHPQKITGAVCHYFPAGKIKLAGNNLQYLIHLPKIIRLIRHLKPDILNSHFLSSFGLFAFLSMYGHHIINVHGTDVLINARKSVLTKLLYSKILHSAWHVFSVSENMTHVLTGEFNLDPSKITTIQYGVDINIFSLKEKWETREYDFITNRAFIPNSNYTFILKTMGEFKQFMPNFKFLIVGEGPLKDDIKRKIEKYHLEENVKMKDPVSAEEMAGLLNNSRFFLSFTTSDGTPLSLFEAVACGCFPILSANQSYSEWATRGLKAELIPLNRLEETTNKITKCFKIDLRNSINENLKFVQREMNYSTNMAFVMQIMKTFLS